MSRKNIIIAISVVVVLAALYFGYRAFFSGSDAPPAPATAPVTSASRILPMGNRFDLSLLKKYNADAKLFNYPIVNASEVGSTLNDLAKKGP